MATRESRAITILRVVLAVIFFSIFLMLDSVFNIGDPLVARGWPLALILLTFVLIRLLFAGLAVLVVLPLTLRMRIVQWLPGYLRFDLKDVLLGLLSFAVFCVLAAAIALVMGIFKGDPLAVLSRPDIRPDPDVVGWGYFLLALVPGIWEELAFRGLIQSTLRRAFSSKATILLSAAFFGLYHFSSLATQAPAPVIGGVVMAFSFGIAWATMTEKAGSVIPAMLSHYLVDSMGQVFLGVDASNPALSSAFFLLLTISFPIVATALTTAMYKKRAAPAACLA